MPDHGEKRVRKVARAHVVPVKPTVARRRRKPGPASSRNFETLLSKMEVGDAQRFRRLLKENADLRRIIRKLTSDNAALRQLLSPDR